MADPKIADNKPKGLKTKAGVYFWCACGQSKNQPYCDGSHRGTEFTPVQVTIDDEKDVYWCMCKHSKNKPFCDGSHHRL